LADRYVYTAYARDIVRGSSPTWVRKVYDFAIKPDATFYFRVPIERISVGRPKLKYYEAGMDLDLSNDPYDSYRIFQSRIIEQYESMIKSEGFIVIDGTSGIEEQQQLVRETISKLLRHKEEKGQKLQEPIQQPTRL
jgi:dTMP kinase